MKFNLKSYIKLYGPPILKALHVLEKIAAESPEVLIKSFYRGGVPLPGMPTRREDMTIYFDTIPVEISMARKNKLISESGHTLGENDFFFEWARDPTWKEIDELITKIDEALAPLGCKYTIATR